MRCRAIALLIKGYGLDDVFELGQDVRLILPQVPDSHHRADHVLSLQLRARIITTA
jgi:hypothetical protein